MNRFDDLSRGALLNRRHLGDNGGCARAIVTDDGNMLALMQDEVCILQRMDAAIALGQTPGFQNDPCHGAAP